MHECMSALRQHGAERCFYAAAATAAVIAIVMAGCRLPFGLGGNSCHCASECEPVAEECCEPQVCEQCGHMQILSNLQGYACTLPHCSCGYMKEACRVPCEKCGYLLHFCEDSDYVGPVEPPRPPRFHPVPTLPVLTHGLMPAE
jgi:hypothetical protein